MIVGSLLHITHLQDDQHIYTLNADTFFLFLLPPIVLETGYYLPKRAFFDNIGTILLLAVLNKIFNTICIGVTLWAIGKTILYGGTPFGLLECLLFASFITAVDPIAVLATFVEIRVNDTLYIVVFGESLLNDAVSIVRKKENSCRFVFVFIKGTLSNVRKFSCHRSRKSNRDGYFPGCRVLFCCYYRWYPGRLNIRFHGRFHDSIY